MRIRITIARQGGAAAREAPLLCRCEAHDEGDHEVHCLLA